MNRRNFDLLQEVASPWRNRLARLTVNQEVGSSSLPGDAFFALFSLLDEFILDPA